jgi:hypothetical protein
MKRVAGLRPMFPSLHFSFAKFDNLHLSQHTSLLPNRSILYRTNWNLRSEVERRIKNIEFSTKLNQLVKTNRFQEANQLYKETISKGLPLDATFLRVVLKLYAKQKMIPEMLGTFEELTKKGDKGDTNCFVSLMEVINIPKS